MLLNGVQIVLWRRRYVVAIIWKPDECDFALCHIYSASDVSLRLLQDEAMQIDAFTKYPHVLLK